MINGSTKGRGAKHSIKHIYLADLSFIFGVTLDKTGEEARLERT